MYMPVTGWSSLLHYIHICQENQSSVLAALNHTQRWRTVHKLRCLRKWAPVLNFNHHNNYIFLFFLCVSFNLSSSVAKFAYQKIAQIALSHVQAGKTTASENDVFSFVAMTFSIEIFTKLHKNSTNVRRVWLYETFLAVILRDEIASDRQKFK